MTLEEQITERIKEAMKSKNKPVLGTLRMVKSEAQIAKAAPGFNGEPNDAFWREVIARYVKKQIRAREEFAQAGEAGKEKVAELTFEIDYLSEFLPRKLGAEEVQKLVRQAIQETNAQGPQALGRVIGAVMKTHKDQVDAAMVKDIAARELG